jgi:hypothetical protein
MSTKSNDSVPSHEDVSVPPSTGTPAPVNSDATVTGALGGYPPLAPTAAEPASKKKSRLWLWLTIGAAATLVIAGTSTAVVVSALTPRNESLAQITCLAATADQMKNPSSTKFSKVMVGRGWDKKASKPVVLQWVNHATADDAAGLADAVTPFANDAGDGLVTNTYVVTAAVDGTNSYGAVVRQYVLCYVGVVDTKVTKKPTEVFTSSN